MSATVDMCKEAVAALKDRNGSSRHAIKAFVFAMYGVELTPTALTRALSTGYFVKHKGSYKLTPQARSRPRVLAREVSQPAAASAAAPVDVVDLCSSDEEETATAPGPAAAARSSQQDVQTLVGITGQSESEAKSALADTGGLQAATERWFLAHNSASNGRPPQLQPGDYVKLTAAALDYSVSEGPLKRGDAGIVCVVEEGDEEPYQIMASGRTWWYQAGEIALDSSGLQRVRVKKEINKLKPTDVEDIPHDPDCYITTNDASPPASQRNSIASTPLDSPAMDGDLQVVVNDPMLNAPHARFNCRQPGLTFVRCPYIASSWRPAPVSTLVQNRKYCPSCFCFVCDVEASKCESWNEHCLADDINPHWAALRRDERHRQEDEKLMNSEGLPRFMRGLPKEMEANQLTAAQAGYRAVLRVMKPSPTPGWPRKAGHFEFLLPRCVTHTHTDLPVNATLTNYFDIRDGAAPYLMNSAGKMTEQCEALVKTIVRMQAAGHLQVKWTVHHVDRPGFDAGIAKKLADLAKHRPATFDLARKYVPPAQYRDPGKVYEDRPAQAEGNSEWWSAVRYMKCKPGPTTSVPATSGRAHIDNALNTALSQNDCRTHCKENCCWMCAEIHFEKRLAESRYSSARQEVKQLMRDLVKNDFRPDEVTPAAELAEVAPFAELNASADALLAAGKHQDAISAYTKALEVPVRQRRGDADNRKTCLVRRAQARLQVEDAKGAEDDCTAVLAKDEHCAEAFHLYGQILMRLSQQKEAACAAFRRALVEDPGNAEFQASLDTTEPNAASAAAAAGGSDKKSSKHSSKQTLTISVTNTLQSRVELYVVGTQKEMDTVSTSRGGTDWTDASMITARFDREMIRETLSRGHLYARYTAPKFNSNSDPKKDLGITFKPNSFPPEIMAVDPSSAASRLGLKQGMVLSHVSQHSGYAYSSYSRDLDNRKYIYSTKNKTHQQILAHIRSHKRPILLICANASTGGKKHLGSLGRYVPRDISHPYLREPCVHLLGIEGTKLVAEVDGQAVMSVDALTFTAGDVHMYICKTSQEARRKMADKAWAKHCKKRVADRFKAIDSTVLAASEGELLNEHIRAIDNPAELTGRSQFNNLRRLQDSPLFGLSEGYFDKSGLKRELPENPPQLAVTLRNYQSQAVQWMLDHEARSSISEPYWAEVPMAVSEFRRPALTGPRGPSSKEGKMWYCHLSGELSETPPEDAVGGILAEEMGMGKTVEVLGLLALTVDSMRQWQLARPACGTSKPRGGTLICCPVSLYGQWKAEIRSKLKKDHQMTIYEYHTGRRFDAEEIAKADIVLTCYSIMNREEDGVKLRGKEPFTCPLKIIEWYRVVLDECHVIKEASTKQSKMACSFQTRRRWAVTGTVMQTKHDDIAPIYQFLRLQPFHTSAGWKAAMYPHASRYSRSSISLNLLSNVMKHSVMRHMKNQIFDNKQILQLPERSQCVRLLHMSDAETKLYEELERRSKQSFATIKDPQRETLKVISLLLPLRMLASSAANVEAKHVTAEQSNPAERIYTEKELVQVLHKQGRKLSKEQAESTVVQMRSSTSSCSVCLDNVENPTSTACGHVYCHECIAGVIHSTPGDTAPCPNCRVPVKDSTLLRLVPKPILSSSNSSDENSEAFEKLLLQTQGKRSTKVTALLASLHEMRRSEPNAKAVVFTSFAKTHKETVLALKAEKFGVVEIRGNMTQKARSKALERFATDSGVSIFALSLRSGAVGLTLTAASRCFLMEPCVNEGTELQAVNRIHRMGQTKKVKIVTFVSRGTVEERLLELRSERAASAAAAAAATSAASGSEPGSSSMPIRGGTAPASTSTTTIPGGHRSASSAGSAVSMAEMQRFQAANAKIEDWQLMFGTRKSTAQLDLGDPDPEAAAVNDIIKNGLPKTQCKAETAAVPKKQRKAKPAAGAAGVDPPAGPEEPVALNDMPASAAATGVASIATSNTKRGAPPAAPGSGVDPEAQSKKKRGAKRDINVGDMVEVSQAACDSHGGGTGTVIQATATSVTVEFIVGSRVTVPLDSVHSVQFSTGDGDGGDNDVEVSGCASGKESAKRRRSSSRRSAPLDSVDGAATAKQTVHVADTSSYDSAGSNTPKERIQNKTATQQTEKKHSTKTNPKVVKTKAKTKTKAEQSSKAKAKANRHDDTALLRAKRPRRANGGNDISDSDQGSKVGLNSSYQVGDRVTVKFSQPCGWFAGVIKKVLGEKTYKVLFDDGESWDIDAKIRAVRRI